MSYYYTVILITAFEDGGDVDIPDPNVDILNQYLEDDFKPHLTKDIISGRIFLGQINQLKSDEFVKVFRAINWEHPEQAQLLINREDDLKFDVYTISKNVEFLDDQSIRVS